MSVHPRNVLLALLVGVLVALNVALERPLDEVEAQGPLLPAFEAAAVARVEIAAGAEGARNPLVIERDADGAWRVLTRFGFPAFEPALNDLFQALALITRDDLAGDVPAAHPTYGVGGDGVRLALFDATGRRMFELVQGAPEGLRTGSYVRLGAEDEVYRASGLAPLAVEPDAWLDAELVAFEPLQVRGVSVFHKSGRVLHDLLRGERGWRVLNSPGAEAYASRVQVERLLQIASTLYFARVVGADLRPEQGFGSPPYTVVEVDVGEDELRSFWIGAPIEPGDAAAAGADPRGAYYATNPHWEKPWVVALPSETVDVLFAAIDALSE